MPTYFITRQSGAITWAERQGIKVDECIAHLDIDLIRFIATTRRSYHTPQQSKP